MLSRINPFADPQRTRASADATTSSTPTSRQTPAPSNQFLEPLLNRRTDPSAEAQINRPDSFADVINRRNTQGDSALAQAIQHGSLAVATTLLKHKETNVTLANERGQAPLHHAVKAENPEFAARLLRHGRTLLWQSLDSWHINMSLGEPETPLPRWSKILGMLAASPKVNSNLHNSKGETPLTFLCKLSCPWEIAVPLAFDQWRNRSVQAMLEGSRRGQGQLDPEAKNAAGKTPYQVALAENNTSLAQVFEADAEARRLLGRSGHP